MLFILESGVLNRRLEVGCLIRLGWREAKGLSHTSHSGVAPGWFEDPPLELTEEIGPLRRPKLKISTTQPSSCRADAA